MQQVLAEHERKSKKKTRDPVMSSSIAQLLHKIKAFENLEMRSSQSVEAYTQYFCHLDREISYAACQVIPEPILIAKYLDGLGTSFENFRNRFMVSHSLFDEQNNQSVTLRDLVWDALTHQCEKCGLLNVLIMPSDLLLSERNMFQKLWARGFRRRRLTAAFAMVTGTRKPNALRCIHSLNQMRPQSNIKIRVQTMRAVRKKKPFAPPTERCSKPNPTY